MGWSLGYDHTRDRDIGYGVEAKCDHPGCDADIDRGLSYLCGDLYDGGEYGCGGYFCPEHLHVWLGDDSKRPWSGQLCFECNERAEKEEEDS